MKQNVSFKCSSETLFQSTREIENHIKHLNRFELHNIASCTSSCSQTKFHLGLSKNFIEILENQTSFLVYELQTRPSVYAKSQVVTLFQIVGYAFELNIPV